MIHTLCGTPLVESFGAAMYDRGDFFINCPPISPFADSVPDRYRNHAAIVAALEAGEAEAARSAASAHIFGTVALIERTIDRSGARAVA